MSVNIKMTRDNAEAVMASIRRLTQRQVLVGYPESVTQREDAQEPTNAYIAMVQEFGSPVRNIPARPTLIPGVEKALPDATRKLEEAARAAMDAEPYHSEQAMKQAGFLAASGVKREITNGSFVPLSPKTIAQRHLKRRNKTMRDSEKEYLQLVADGTDPATAQEITDIKPLINTGQMRAAVTFVLRPVK